MSVQRYVKKPVVVEAVRWTGDNLEEIQAFAGDSVLSCNPLVVGTLEGPHQASIGDYIIRGVAGEFYPCKPAIFKKTYDLLDAP